jgi:hypothetical protein
MTIYVSVVEVQYKVGKVDNEIISDARNAGLSEVGIEAMIKGDRATYKRELDVLERRIPGNVWACMSGYALWFNAATTAEQNRDYREIERQLKCLPR